MSRGGGESYLRLYFHCMMHSITWWPILVAVVVATVADLHSRRIPNWLVFPLLFGGIAASVFDATAVTFVESMAGFSLGLGIAGALWWLGGLGAGDMKLIAAIGAWIGPDQLLVALVGHRHYGRHHGRALGSLLPAFNGMRSGHSRSAEHVEDGYPSAGGIHACESNQAQDALCARDRNRYDPFFFWYSSMNTTGRIIRDDVPDEGPLRQVIPNA